jgi:hypothetical protein
MPSLNRAIENYCRWAIRNRWLISIGVLMVAAIASYGLRFLRINESYRAFFGQSNPFLQTFDALEKKYTRIDNVYFAIAPADGDAFTADTLRAIEELTGQAWLLPHASRVDSLTNYQFCRADGDDLFVGDLVEDAANLTPEDIAKLREIVISDPAIKGRLLSPDSKVAGINVTFQMPNHAVSGEWNDTATHARALAAQVEANHPGVEVYLTGFVMLNNAFREAALKDIYRLMPTMYVCVFVLVFIFLRSITGTIATMAIVGLSTSTGMGIAGWFGLEVTGPLTTVAPLIMTLAVADSIHILVSIRQWMRTGLAKNEAITRSLQTNGMAEIITCVMTSVGFLSMNYSDSPPLHDVGNITTVGIVAAFVYTMFLMPALAAILPIGVPRKGDTNLRWVERAASLVIAHRHLLLAGSVAVIVVLCALISRNEMDERVAEYFDKSLSFRQDSEFVVEHMGGAYVMEFSLDSGQPDGISDPAYLTALDGFTDWLRAQPGVAHVAAFSDIMKRVNKSMHGDDPNYFRIPDERGLAAQYLLFFEMSLPTGLDLNNQIDVNKSSTRVMILTDALSSNDLRALGGAATRWLGTHAQPSMVAEASGSALLFAHLTERNMRDMISGTFTSLFVISGIMILGLRNIRYGLISLIPNVVPSAMAFGIWGLTVGHVSFALSIVSSMSFGIIVDDTVHYLEHYAHARRDLRYSVEDSIRHAFSTVGTAVLATTIIVGSGFLILALSSFSFNRDMALLSAIVIACAFVADLVLLPTLLMMFDGEWLKSGRDKR